MRWDGDEARLVGWRGFENRPDSARRRRARLLLPVVISLAFQVPPALFWLVWRGVSLPTILTLVFAVLGPLALLWARRFPGPTVLVVALLASADFFIVDRTPGLPYLALAFAIGSALVRGARIWAWVSVGAAWTTTLIVGLSLGRDWPPAVVAVTTLGILIVFGIGEGMRGRREMLADYRRTVQQRRQTEVQAERVRIARELHDVLAHSLSQINVQAGVGLHLMQRQPDKAAEALLSIKETSKTALDEVRSVLGVLRSESHDPDAPLVPEPDLARIPGLAASITAQGVDVTTEVGAVEAPQAVQLALYRITQESLTNVLRHAHASRAHVSLGVVDGAYQATIDDDGDGLDDTAPTEGRGLLGMRERAELLGGTLSVHPSPWGGTRVLARIPFKEADR